MIARLICRLFGHRWTSWEGLHGHVEHRECVRCLRYDVRRVESTEPFYRYRFTMYEPESGPAAPGGMTRPECREIVEKMRAAGIVEQACTCNPRRDDIHACPIDPDDVGFVGPLMRIPPP